LYNGNPDDLIKIIDNKYSEMNDTKNEKWINLSKCLFVLDSIKRNITKQQEQRLLKESKENKS